MCKLLLYDNQRILRILAARRSHNQCLIVQYIIFFSGLSSDRVSIILAFYTQDKIIKGGNNTHNSSIACNSGQFEVTPLDVEQLPDISLSQPQHISLFYIHFVVNQSKFAPASHSVSVQTKAKKYIYYVCVQNVAVNQKKKQGSNGWMGRRCPRLRRLPTQSHLSSVNESADK